MNSSKPILIEINSGILCVSKDNTKVQSEQEIIQGCLKGVREYEDILYKKYSPVAYGICLRYSKNQEEAQDLMHDSLIKVFTNLKSFRSDSSLKTWITRITLNQVFNHLKKKSIGKIDKDVYDLNVADHESSDENEASQSEYNITTEELIEMFQFLPFGYRTILNLYAVEKYSHKEIAKLLGISESTSKTQLFRARKKLKKLLSKHIIKCTVGIK